MPRYDAHHAGRRWRFITPRPLTDDELAALAAELAEALRGLDADDADRVAVEVLDRHRRRAGVTP